jgi:integrase
MAEVLLQWQQVDFDNKVVRLLAKGGEPRTVPLSRRAYEILWAERGRNQLWVFTFVAKKTRLCPKTKKKYVRGERYPITYYGLTSYRRRDWAKAGVTHGFHALRHTAGRRTLRATRNLKTTQMLLGHSDISTTAKFYIDVLQEEVLQAMEDTAIYVESRKNSRTETEGRDKPLESNTKKP